MRTSNLALCTAESHRPVRRHERTDRNRLVAIAEIVALIAIVVSLIAGTIATSAGGDTQTQAGTPVLVEQEDTVDVPTAAQTGSTVAYR